MEFGTPYDLPASSCGREATEVGFMYFSPEEVKNLSAVEINDLSTNDEWGAPISGGLHSLEMGPLKDFRNCSMVCQTCGLDQDCPGHMGHIELSSPLYNPFLIAPLLKLLRQTCLNCHKFKCHEAVTAALVLHLQGLLPGDLPAPPAPAMKSRSAFLSDAAHSESMTLVIEEITKEGVSMKREILPERDVKETGQAIDSLIKKLDSAREKAQKADAKTPSGAGRQNSASIEALRAVIASFFAEMPNSCARCKAHAKWRKEGYEALFVKPDKKSKELLALPQYARDLLTDLWKNEAAALRYLVPAARGIGPEVFFLERLLVPPNRFRPPKQGDVNPAMLQLHRHTKHLKSIMLANQQVRNAMKPDRLEEVAQPLELHQAVGALQQAVNSFMDKMKSGKNPKLVDDGIRQLLEKKEGLFRMKMMGKRVNFAARSVISPDPNIEPSEIGVPQDIASELVYPEVATQYNAEWLRDLVERGARYPGALEVHAPRADGGKIITNLKVKTKAERKALAKNLITDIRSGKPPWTVFRQLQDGDPLLVNRQPTLHKPGIMAHMVKVLRRERTIRLHYVNCNTYNADFDGDEMNLHAPQDPISRMEALAIARADFQYLVPTSGKPLRGLIQDHVIAGTMLTKRDSFYTRPEVCLLLYTGLRHALEPSKPKPKARKASGGDDAQEWEDDEDDEEKQGKDEEDRDPFEDKPWHRPKLNVVDQRMKITLDPPAMLRPVPMWSGKQVLGMLLKHLIKICSEGKACETSAGINLDGKSKTPGDIWNGRLDGDKEEATIVFRGSDLLQGVLDKASFGAEAAGITHLCFELMGGRLASLWLSGIARLFTLLLQMRGFTCAYEDLILRPETDDVRTELVKKAREAAVQVAEQWIHKHGAGSLLPERPTLEQLSVASKDLFLQKQKVEHLEGLVIGKMKEFWSGMINQCIPVGQRLPVPRNCFASMVQTGAKGSKVNQSQVSCCLGQQELEGRLPPLMGTQRSLPCFAVNDLSNRTRGYIADRFLTGIRPQEFFFHCMAGREGLVDTAVKTSRSGYLQRCLVKHLETLKVEYDHTVRDGDGSILQFLYGEDGADVTRATYLYKFDELLSNFHFLDKPARSKMKTSAARDGIVLDTQCAPLYLKAKQAAKDGDLPVAIEAIEELLEMSNSLNGAAILSLQQLRKKLRVAKKRQLPICDSMFDPVTALFGPAHYFGSTSELHEEALQAFMKKRLENGAMTSKQAKHFATAMRLKFQRTLAEPGEAVGVIAAQSMGEPSTQMTLNTFHLAGHGGANVTLGIPRLREIIQTASRSCSTPLMAVPVLSTSSDGQSAHQQRLAAAQSLKRRFRKVTVMDCVARMAVNESTRLVANRAVWVYHCRIEFMAIDELCKAVPYVTRERLKVDSKSLEIFRRSMSCLDFSLQVASKASRLAKQLRSVPETNDADAVHVAWYRAWAGGSGAAMGVRAAASTLKEAEAALKLFQDSFAEVSFSLQEQARSQVPEKLQNQEMFLSAAQMADVASRDSADMAADCSKACAALGSGSTAWVELPDPAAAAAALDTFARALEEGYQKLAVLRGVSLAATRRLTACAQQPAKRRKAEDKANAWRSAREGMECLAASWSKPDAGDAAQSLNASFHAFDDLIASLVRVFEELDCLGSDVSASASHPLLIAATEVQAEMLGWKLTLLNEQLVHLPDLRDFLETVLAVGDALDIANASLQRERLRLVECLKIFIETEAAMTSSILPSYVQ
ncbi:unnamed protein product [Effrenium voratum]|nr:unnamed protein product [Effrenium voratum]